MEDERFGHTLRAVDGFERDIVLEDAPELAVGVDHKVVVWRLLISEIPTAVPLQVVAARGELATDRFLTRVGVLASRRFGALLFEPCEALPTVEDFLFEVGALVVAICLSLSRFFVYRARVFVFDGRRVAGRANDREGGFECIVGGREGARLESRGALFEALRLRLVVFGRGALAKCFGRQAAEIRDFESFISAANTGRPREVSALESLREGLLLLSELSGRSGAGRHRARVLLRESPQLLKIGRGEVVGICDG